MKVSLKHRVEYVLLRGVLGAFHLLPASWVLGLAGWLARLAYPFTGKRRREAWRRIRQVKGPGLTEAVVRRIAWLSFRNLWLNAAEMVLARRAGWLDRTVAHHPLAEIYPHIERLRGENRGVVVALAHAGNWDLAGVMAVHRGIPALFIARNQKNPLANRLLNQFREMNGALVVDRDDPGLFKKMVRGLRENRLLAILVDLRARTPGTDFRFLGHPAALGAGLGLLAQLSGAPVMPVFLRRLPDGRHASEFGEILRFDPSRDRDEERLRILQATLDFLSERLLAEPQQYFWYNKRWVLEPFPRDQNPPPPA